MITRIGPYCLRGSGSAIRLLERKQARARIPMFALPGSLNSRNG